MTESGLLPAGPAASTAVLLQLVRDGRPRTRAELAAQSGLARSTVAERIDALLDSGLLRHTDKGPSTGGRPPSMYAFNPEARVVLAADVGATHVNAALTDLAGEVLAEEDRPIDIAAGPEAVLEDLCRLGGALLEQVGRTQADLLGIGIGLPGPVEHSSGRPTNPPIMPGWDGFDVPGYVRQRLGAVTLVDNDVNIMAIGEHRAHWAEAQHMIYVKVATGIGSGLIAGGQLHRGSQGVAGDMGHVRLPDGAQVPCRCGNVGCLEAVASGAALAHRLTELGHPAGSSGDVVALARNGSVTALNLVRQAGRDIGEVLAAAVSFFNPSVIVVGGALSQAGEHLIAGVREIVYQRSLPLATQNLRIVQSRAGERAGIYGAALMVVEDALGPTPADSLFPD
ncbi:ROK family transcriptional regulator [Streptomyces sp. ACA25]|uniref:ROK family transcriptional regulator n=1 Tax=Streptomyces sp. ACA25 TaxID=3022596 RepID=UPI0023077FDE|nr:ROK family transcriptional regulator [Streptomyces sp. ACA25]MDB1086443.1 ROK family transcriptional regulator [Streptomyces sp. ACA25]